MGNRPARYPIIRTFPARPKVRFPGTESGHSRPAATFQSPSSTPSLSPTRTTTRSALSGWSAHPHRSTAHHGHRLVDAEPDPHAPAVEFPGSRHGQPRQRDADRFRVGGQHRGEQDGGHGFPSSVTLRHHFAGGIAQIRIVLSPPADARAFPSGRHATVHTPPVCPSSLAVCFPVAGSHTRTVSSTAT